MVNIIVGEKVTNKVKEIGTILSFENNIIQVDFGDRIAKLTGDAFEKGFLKYVKADLQKVIDESILKEKLEKERKEAEVRRVTEKAYNDLLYIQKMASRTQFRVSVVSAAIRLDPASINFRSVRKKDIDLIQNIFAECDKETETLYSSFNPKMEYRRDTSVSKVRSKYCVGFLTKYLGVYVFRVFSRNDVYNNSEQNGLIIKHSDTTEVLRILKLGDRDYYFTKNVSFSGGYFSNTNANNNWHVSDVNSSVLLNEVIQSCDCEYLNDHISVKNIELLQYVKLLLPAFNSNKVEIVFKNKAFSSAYRIDDIVNYLDNFSSKQIDLASKNDALNTLPIIKKYGLCDCLIIRELEKIMRKRRSGHSIYNVLLSSFSRLGFDCPDLDKRLINFLKKVNIFHAGVYFDYINELVNYPDVTIQDFFDKDYTDRHVIMLRQKMVRVSEEKQKQYSQIAAELSWIDREENELYIIVPKTIAEFLHEGEGQHNCVYTNEYYDEVIYRNSIIVFLRKDKNTPYVTIEFEYETFEVYQALGKYNRPIDDELYRYIVDLGKRLRYEMLSQQ